MAASLDNLPEIKDIHGFNESRWADLCADATLAALVYRIETDRFGHILMSPPPFFEHSFRQGYILKHLGQLMPGGHALPEVPVSTAGGVKAIDAAWISGERLSGGRGGGLLRVAPEICVEVLSPSNTREELEEKKGLYFLAGAEEVWVCGLDGQMLFYRKATPDDAANSHLCAGFPRVVE